MLSLLDFLGRPKSTQPEQQKQRKNKSYETLSSHKDDPLIPIKLHLFEEIAFNLNKFLARFQTSVPIVPFLVNSLENLTLQFCQKVNPVRCFEES